jgi:hypothetical protein
MKPRAEFKLVTPKIAQQLLDKNKKNRPVNNDNLTTIISEMNKSRFKITGESIKISKTDVLLDGQHRLLAILKTQKPVELLIVSGLDDDAFKFMDTGRSRQASDVLAIDGISNSKKIASITKFIISFQANKYFAAATQHHKREIKITNYDVSVFVDKNLDSLNDSYAYGFNKQNKLINGATLAAFHYVFKQINDSDADDFCHKLASGEGLEQASPIYVLRQRLLSDIRSTLKMTPIQKIAILCKTWNLYRKGKTVSFLKWDSTKEPFPKPI